MDLRGTQNRSGPKQLNTGTVLTSKMMNLFTFFVQGVTSGTTRF